MIHDSVCSLSGEMHSTAYCVGYHDPSGIWWRLPRLLNGVSALPGGGPGSLVNGLWRWLHHHLFPCGRFKTQFVADDTTSQHLFRCPGDWPRALSTTAERCIWISQIGAVAPQKPKHLIEITWQKSTYPTPPATTTCPALSESGIWIFPS